MSNREVSSTENWELMNIIASSQEVKEKKSI